MITSFPDEQERRAIVRDHFERHADHLDQFSTKEHR